MYVHQNPLASKQQPNYYEGSVFPYNKLLGALNTM